MKKDKRIIAFAASSSRRSINKKLVTYAASLLPAAEVEILDLNDYELPLFSVDREAELGQPALAQSFVDRIAACDGLLISFAEHNGNYTVAYKNIFDWASRINPMVYEDKPMVLLATSPGGRGGRSVLDLALNQMPRFGGQVLASLAVPSFMDNFDSELGRIGDDDLARQIREAVEQLVKS